MVKAFLRKLIDTIYSIVPIVILITIVFLVGLIPSTFNNSSGDPIISTPTYLIFLLCAVFLIIGSTFFQIGADNGLAKVGTYIGGSITKKGSIILLVLVAFFLGVLITVAEPDLTIFGDALSSVLNKWVLKLLIGIGFGVFFVIGILRIIYQKPIKSYFLFSYVLIFALASLFGPKDGGPFLSISFDASSVITGPATVPFIIAFGASVAATRGGKDTASDSFGLAGIMSIGPIISMLLICLIKQPVLSIPNNIDPYTTVLLNTIFDDVLGILPIFLFFLGYNFFVLKLNKREFLKVLLGFGFALVGLYIFLASATIGCKPLGNELGRNIASNESIYYLFLILGFTTGFVMVLAEPTIQILTGQVQEISGGVIKKKSMTIGMALGVGIALTLELSRLVFWNAFPSYYFFIPIYILALLLSFFVPDIYTAIAFDSGGISSGVLAVSFILPFTLGAVEVLGTKNGTTYSGFGIIGMNSCVPIVAIELIGLIAKIKSVVINKKARQRVYEYEDCQVIHFGVNNEKSSVTN